jgi:hypothetical protein
MAKTKRRACHTTKRKGKGKGKGNGKAKRFSRRDGGKKRRGLSLRRGFRYLYDKFIPSQLKNLEQVEEGNKIIGSDNDNFINYVQLFMGCYKDEYFFKRSLKRGKCQTLSDQYENIFLLPIELKQYLLGEIKPSITQLLTAELYHNKEKLDAADETFMVDEEVERAIGFFQVITGIERNKPQNYTPKEKKNVFMAIGEPSFNLTKNVYFQEVVARPWNFYFNKISRSADKYLTRDDIEELKKHAYEVIAEIKKSLHTPSSSLDVDQTRFTRQYNSTPRVSQTGEEARNPSRISTFLYGPQSESTRFRTVDNKEEKSLFDRTLTTVESMPAQSKSTRFRDINSVSNTQNPLHQEPPQENHIDTINQFTVGSDNP